MICTVANADRMVDAEGIEVMGKLIDSDALIAEINVMPIDIGFEDIDRALQVIEEQPEAIVRCKDCIHDNDCAIQDIAQTGFNFFCGCAERGTILT